MAKLITALATIAVIMGIVGILAVTFSDESARARQIDNYYAEQYQALRLAEQEAWQRDYEPTIQAVSAGAIVTLTGIAVLGAGALVYAVASALVHAAAGLKPDHRYRVRELEARKLVLMADAQNRHALPITSLHYAPHYSNRQDGVALPGDVAEQAPAAVPSFADLLSSGKVGKGNPLLLGYTSEGSELVGSWLDLYSTAVGGLPGTGKTTSQRYLAAQTALHGAKFVVADPHYGAADDSLGGTLAPLLAHCGLCDVASDDKAIVGAVKLVADIGKKRIAGDKDRTPIILWVDESTALLNRSTVGPALAELLEGISQEFRKVSVYASISGQIWTADRAGGSALRDSLASCLVHRMKRPQARMLVPTDTARLVENLSVGQAILYRTSGQVDTLGIPNTTSQDMTAVAGLLAGDHPTVEVGPGNSTNYTVSEVDMKSSGSGFEVGREATSTAAASTPLPADVARVLALFSEGHSTGEIAQQVYQAPKSGGKSTEARRLVESIIRTHYQPQARAVGE